MESTLPFATRSSGGVLLRRMLIGRRPRRTFWRALVLAAVCFVVFRFALIPVYVNGESMLPTYRDRSVNFANRLVYRLRDPRPGEVVVIEMAGRRTMFLKRILAVPGQTVRFEDGVLRVDGQPVPEPYVRLSGDWTTAVETLGNGEYFVAGDNRGTPWEQHSMGVVDRRRIAGRIVF
jgi:signal peptidase I